MNVFIILFGVFIFIAGIAIVIKPETIFDFFSKYSDSLGLYIGAIVGRLILGVLLIYSSDVSKFPVAMGLIGLLSIVAAIVLAAVGRNRFQHLMRWAFSLLKPFARVGGAFALAFGGFLVYAFI